MVVCLATLGYLLYSLSEENRQLKTELFDYTIKYEVCKINLDVCENTTSDLYILNSNLTTKIFNLEQEYSYCNASLIYEKAVLNETQTVWERLENRSNQLKSMAPSHLLSVTEMSYNVITIDADKNYYLLGVANSGSMKPVLDDHRVIVWRDAPFSVINVGDVIVYERRDGNATGWVLHRIVEKYSDYVKAEGDANGVIDDDVINATNFKGVVVGILYGGK